MTAGATSGTRSGGMRASGAAMPMPATACSGAVVDGRRDAHGAQIGLFKRGRVTSLADGGELGAQLRRVGDRVGGEW